MSHQSSEKNFYPLFLDLSGLHCLVAGLGGVGSRKLQGLLQCAPASILALDLSLIHICIAAQPFYAAHGFTAVETAAPCPHEQGLLSLGRQCAPLPEPGPQRRHGCIRQRRHALARPLAENADDALFQPQIRHIEPQGFGDAQPGAVQQFRQGMIPGRKGIPGGGGDTRAAAPGQRIGSVQHLSLIHL